jgi:hypothetical protein
MTAMTLLVVSCLVISLLLAATLGRLVVVRRRLTSRTDVFRCKVRVISGAVPHLSHRWPLRSCRAQWSHDVLLLHSGLWLTSANPVAVRFAESVIEPAQPTSRVRMRPSSVMLRLRLDDDTVIALAAPAAAWEQLAGPFIAIAAQGLSSTTKGHEHGT